MATVTFYIPIDMRTFANYNFNTIQSSGGGGSTNPDHYAWDFNGGFHYDISGTTLSGGFYAPTSGTVTGWDLGFFERLYNAADPFNPIIVDHMYWSFSGLSVPAADFGSAIQSDGATLAAYMPTLLAGDDTIYGSDFDDYLLGFTGNDTIYGNAGNDTLEGGRGTDTLEGGSGNDTLDGGQGVDHMTGGLGDDIFIVNRAGETVIEAASAGTDLVKSSVNYVLPANVENLELAGSSPVDGTGNSLANVITGSPGANTLAGQGGNDDLRGSGGNDRLLGGTGNDTLKGGAGQDTFVMNTTLNASTNVDQIVDFAAADDTIELASSIFTQVAPGALASANFYAGSSAHDADDRIIYDSATGKIYYDSDGNGPIEQVLFAQVAAGTVVTDADFLII
jgi:Ca2+-binding RTX toxin-like protein